MYLGDFKEDGDIFFKFTTRAFATGVPTTLDGSPVLSVYKDEGGAATEKTTSETYFDLDVDHDSIVGWNNVRIDLSGDAFFATGADYSVVITTGTVDSVNVFGENLANFSIENRSMGQPVGATLSDDIAAIKAQTVAIEADTDVIDDGTSGLVKIASDVAAVLVDTGTTLPLTLQGLVIAQGTIGATGNSTTKIHLDGLAYGDDDINGYVLVLKDDSTGLFHRTTITDFATSGDLATVPTLNFTPEASTDLYWLLPVDSAHATADEVLTGSTHNVVNSLGRRLRIIQESGSYEGGAVWIDTTANGTAGTTDFENGVDILPVDSIADANTIAGSVGLTRFQVAPGSAITFPGTQSNELWEGRDWTLALASRDITGSFIFGAIVTGVGTATAGYEFEECDIGAVTLDNDGHFELCDLSGTFTIGQAGTFTFHNCFTLSGSAVTIDFAALGATAVHLFGFDGELNFKNMAAGDTVHITGAGSITTETCTAGTIDHDGFFEYTDAGTNVTEQQSDIKVAVDAIKVPTDKMVFSKTNELDANTKSINDAEVVGDGNATPWDGA